MSERDKKALDEVPEEHRSVFVYDFLYHDARRIGSFLAQFDDSGHLQRVRQSETVSKGSKRGYSVELSGKLPVPTGSLPDSAEAGLKYSRDPGSSGSESVEREYDPLWTNALQLLDYLEANGLIKRDIHKAGLGQFVLVSGVLRVLDLRLIRAMWGSSKLLKRFGIGDNGKISKEERENNEVAMEIVKVIPHTIQATLFEKTAVNEQITSISWMNLEPENMVVSPHNILLKYGHLVPGRWHVLAIKDANSDGGAYSDPDLPVQLAKGWESAARERHSSVMALLAEVMSPMVRTAIGRPGLFYGLTPLMIFREIT